MSGAAPFVVDLAIDGLQVVSAGAAVELDYPDEWAKVEASVAAPEVEFEVTIPGEGGETEVFFSDLSHDYVTLNGDYTS